MLKGTAAAAALAMLCGCSTSYKFGDMQSGYQAPEMPLAFSGDGKGLHAVGYFVANDQRPIRYEGDYTALMTGSGSMVDSVYGSWAGPAAPQSIHETYRIRRSPALVGGTLILQSPTWYCGWSAGMALPESEHYHLGTFGGYSGAFGDFVPTLSLGLFMNVIANQGEFWRDPGLFGGSVRFPDSSASKVMNVEIPLKLGIGYRLNSWAMPYAAFGYNTIAFWPQENPNDPEHELTHRDLSLGVRYLGISGLIISVEMAYSSVDIPDRYVGSHVDSKVFLEKSL